MISLVLTNVPKQSVETEVAIVPFAQRRARKYDGSGMQMRRCGEEGIDSVAGYA